MEEGQLILRSLDDLKDTVKTNYEALDGKLDRALVEIDRNKGSISKQFDQGRERDTKIQENHEAIAPAAAHAKNSRKVTIAIVSIVLTSVAGVFAVAFGERIVSVFSGG